MKQALSKRKKAVLEVMSKPKTPSELREQIVLKKGNNISSTLKELINLNLIYCLNPKAETGKLYGLTFKGKKLRKKLHIEKSSPFDYVEPRINWNLYGWVVCGRQRTAMIKAMKTAMPLSLIKKFAKEYNEKISSENAHDISKLFIKKKIATRTKDLEKDIFIYKLTKTGEAIRSQLSEP